MIHSETFEHIGGATVSIDWPVPPPNLSIDTNLIHVWAWDCACSCADLARYIDVLSNHERLRMRRFRLDKDRVRYGVSHAILRILLGHYLGVEPSLVFFEENEFGKPFLRRALAEPRLTFNLSYTDRLVILGVAAGARIGVDIEKISLIERGVVDSYFSTLERSTLASLAGEEWLGGFYNCWTRKEAIIKAEGRGLNIPLNAFDVSLRPGAQAAVLGVRAGADFTSNWQLVELHPGSGFVGALATDAANKSVICYRFESCNHRPC